LASRLIKHNGNSFTISYEILNPDAQKCITFLHGWGSNKELMKNAFKDILSNYKHLYIDLPGFGKSSSDAIMDSTQYTEVVKQFLQELNISYEIILGHSFGGKIATLLQPQKLILVASAGIKLEKPLPVKFKIALSKLFNSLGLQTLKKIIVADDAKALSQNMYESFKKVIEEDLSDAFQKSKSALLLWGESDSATPIIAAKKIDELIDNSKLVIFEGDHYFFLKTNNHQKIQQEIENYAKQ
jgi:non-heme chloroperoxidase